MSIKPLLTAIALLWTCAGCGETNYTPKEGDIVFQESQSQQSPIIAKATGSRATHCGIIVFKEKKPYVLEASKTVRLTPLDKWKSQGKGGKIAATRVFDKKEIKVRYKEYLGMKYDLAFSFDNDKMYCSELVYVIFKKQFGIELAKPKRIKEYKIDKFRDVMKKRKMNPEAEAVAPIDLLKSKKATVVFDGL